MKNVLHLFIPILVSVEMIVENYTKYVGYYVFSLSWFAAVMKLILCSNLNSVINNVLARWAGLFKLCACVAQAMVHVSARHE